MTNKMKKMKDETNTAFVERVITAAGEPIGSREAWQDMVEKRGKGNGWRGDKGRNRFAAYADQLARRGKLHKEIVMVPNGTYTDGRPKQRKRALFSALPVEESLSSNAPAAKATPVAPSEPAPPVANGVPSLSTIAVAWGLTVAEVEARLVANFLEQLRATDLSLPANRGHLLAVMTAIFNGEKIE